MNKVFAAEQLSKTFDPDTSPIHAVKDVSLEICENEIIVLTGRSGSGKSTLLIFWLVWKKRLWLYIL